MPKSAGRRKRIRAARTESAPTALPEATDKSQKGKSGSSKKVKAETNGKEKEILPIIQKLRSTEASERLWSTSAVSHILGTADSGTRRLLQSNNVVALLIERLEDAELQIQAEACGALRNLAIEGGFEVCAEMFNKSIVPGLAKQLDPLNAALVADLSGSKAANDKEAELRKLLWVWSENLATLFWCLAETSDKAFKAVAALHNLSTLLYTILKEAVPVDGSSLGKAKVPVTLALAAAQAVYVLTDSNVPSAPKFPLPRDTSRSAAYINTKSMIMASLQNMASSEVIADADERQGLLQVLFVGIFQNLSHQQAYGKQVRGEEEEDFARLALSVLVAGLEGVNLSQDAASAEDAHKALPKGRAVASAEAKELSEPKVNLDLCEARWTRLRLTLEILGELVGEIDGIVDEGLLGGEVYEEWHGIANGDTDAMEVHDVPTAGPSQQRPAPISEDAMSILSKLPALLLQLAQPTSISFAESAAETATQAGLIATEAGTAADRTYLPVLSDLASLLHGRALECFNNLLITIGRSSGAAAPAPVAAAEDAVDDSMMLLAEGEEEPPAEGEEEDDSMDDDEPEADLIEHNGQSALEVDASDGSSPWIAANIESLQKCWEGLFELLVTHLGLHEKRKGSRDAATSNVSKDKKKMINAQASEDALETALEADLGSIWALARLCVDRLTVGNGESQLLLKVCQDGEATALPVDARVRMCGALGVLASRATVGDAENEAIGKALLAQLSPLAQGAAKQEEAELLTQVVDSLIDVYSDETRSYDGNFRNGGFLEALEAIVPAYRKLVKGIDKRKMPELREQADDVAVNIAEFVKYRKSL